MAHLLGICALTLVLVACQYRPLERTASAASGDPARGREVFVSRGCTGCHTVRGVPGATGTLGPPLTSIASTAGVRHAGLSAEAYIRESVVKPNAFVVAGFPSPSPMPPGLVAGPELDDLIAFLLTQH